MIKFTSCTFCFEVGIWTATVCFQEDVAIVTIGQETPFRVENLPRKHGGRPYKPCETHCRQLISLAQNKPAKTLSEATRRKESRPVLKPLAIKAGTEKDKWQKKTQK